EAQERAEGQEDAVGEVQHAHQAVDEGQTARDEEVDGAQADPGDRQEDHGSHMTPSDPVDTPSRRCVSSAWLRNSAAGPWWTLRPPVRTTAWWASSRTTCRFCSTRRTGTTSAARASTRPTSCTRRGASPLVGSSTRSTRLSLSRARASDTICCCPPDRVPAAWLARSRSSGKSS